MDSYGLLSRLNAYVFCWVQPKDIIQSMSNKRLLVEYQNAHMPAYVEMLVLLHVDDKPHKVWVSVCKPIL